MSKAQPKIIESKKKSENESSSKLEDLDFELQRFKTHSVITHQSKAYY